MKKTIKLLKILAIIVIIIYVVLLITEQQYVLNEYSQTVEELNVEIAKEIEINADLQSQKESIDSLDFIEEVAREKLDMYRANERIYVDSTN